MAKNRKAKIEQIKPEFDNREYWKRIGADYQRNYPMQMYKEIDKAFVKTLESELDLNKVETVFEVGCGFGRVSKLLMPLLANLNEYHAIDLNEAMIEQSRDYCKDEYNRRLFFPYVSDFEANHVNGIYDLVLSVEVMTSIPNTIAGEDRVRLFLDKMITKSKKYVVNQDWFNAPNRIEEMQKPMKPINEINHFHDYDRYYSNHRKVMQVIGHSIPRYTEHIFVARVK